MQSAEYDLGYVSAALPILEDYVLSSDVYWSLATTPPSGGPSYPELSLGNLYLTIAWLAARGLSAEQQATFHRIQGEVERIRSHWRVAWETKAQRSFTSRLRLWGDFIEEYRTSPENNYDRYSYEVRHRVILELLSADVAILPAVELELLAGLDSALRAALTAGDFIWEAELAGGFPRQPYWYLYGRLREV